MQTIKSILAVIAVILAVVGVVLSGAGIYYSWALNGPATETLTGVLSSAARGLTAADRALTRATDGLGRAETAVSTVEGAALAVGETLVETDLAFALLERTVGDTLFPAVAAAHETLRTTAEMVVAFNDSLEAVNRLPFVEVPTLTEELGVAADQLAAAQQRIADVRAELQAMKEDTVGRPVTFVTDRTGPVLTDLQSAQTTIARAQAEIEATLAAIAARQATLARTIDLISLGATAALLWLIAAQVSLGLQAARYVRARN
ncbi:hypothetical protein [Promineifilum sp.]|uniref:hypothetical protein n=1 Tax=Promineifilum sp. TaxID=2664178 RepID=UPI0035B2E420